MADEDNNFGGSLVLDVRKWWCHMQPKNYSVTANIQKASFLRMGFFAI